MARDFSFSDDISHVLWKETLWHNALRATAAGVVWAVIFAAGGSASNPLSALVLMPVGYFLFFLPVGLVASWLSSIPFVGLIAGIFALFITVGDPLVWALSKARPEWVPVDRPAIFSLRLITFVLSPFAE